MECEPSYEEVMADLRATNLQLAVVVEEFRNSKFFSDLQTFKKEWHRINDAQQENRNNG